MQKRVKISTRSAIIPSYRLNSLNINRIPTVKIENPTEKTGRNTMKLHACKDIYLYTYSGFSRCLLPDFFAPDDDKPKIRQYFRHPEGVPGGIWG